MEIKTRTFNFNLSDIISIRITSVPTTMARGIGLEDPPPPPPPGFTVEVELKPEE